MQFLIQTSYHIPIQYCSITLKKSIGRCVNCNWKRGWVKGGKVRSPFIIINVNVDNLGIIENRKREERL